MSKVDHHVDKLPFRKRIFYFDIKTSHNRNKLKNYITRLGGTVAEFLDNRVKYLITDRPQKDWPLKDKNLNNHHDPPQTPQTPEKPVNQLLPRGKQLALRASITPSSIVNTTNAQSSKATTDAIEIAHRRGLKIFEAQQILDFCSKHIRELENPSSCDTSKSTPSTPRTTVRHFKGPFIKIEDVEEKYRPSAKEFKEWPIIYYEPDSFVCPFIPPSKVKKFSENNGEANIARTAETGGITGNTNININNHTNSNTVSSKIPVTPEVTRGNHTMNTKTFEGLGVQTPKASTNCTNDLRQMNRPTPMRKQDIVQYCEICGTTFKNINEHIVSKSHQKELQQKENFKDLFNVMKSLPKWNDICQENKETENPCDDAECDFEYPNYPSLTPPSMPSTTITLTPGSTVKAIRGNTNAKGSFLPLHDYVNSTNKNNSFKVNEVAPGFKMRQVNILASINNNNNPINIANNFNLKAANPNFKISGLNYSSYNNNNNTSNIIINSNIKHNNHNNDRIVDEKVDQLFSDDDDYLNDDEIDASCFTPPLIPPLLYPELDIPEEILRQKSNNTNNINAVHDHSIDDYSLEF